MEPPKKRKYTGLDNEGNNERVNVKEEPSSVLVEENYGEQHAVVSSEGLGGGPAKRNRRSYSLEFKVAVLDSFYNDTETRLNQRKTAIKYGVNRRQIQKWLAQEETLRGSVGAGYTQSHSLGQVPGQTPTASLPSPPSSKEDATSPLSTYLSYQSKIDYLRRGEVGPLTVLEVKGEASEEEELADYVIDEGVEEDDDDRPINLSKSCGDKRPEKDSRQAEPAREQMHEIGSTVTPGLPELPRAPVRSHPDPVSSHILDTTAGRPAAGVAITMSRMGGVNQAWTKVASRLTNEDGRASAFLTWEQFTPGTYKMHFATGQYFRGQEIESFYPYAEVVFEIKDPSKHYHIPLLLNPFGYSTYRGS